MEGEQKFLLIIVCLLALCITVVVSLLFLSLWAYKEWVGGSLLVVVLVSVGVWLRGKLTEQTVRQIRYRHHEETPLDTYGEPMYWHTDAKVNPYRMSPYTQEQKSEYY